MGNKKGITGKKRRRFFRNQHTVSDVLPSAAGSTTPASSSRPRPPPAQEAQTEGSSAKKRKLDLAARSRENEEEDQTVSKEYMIVDLGCFKELL